MMERKSRSYHKDDEVQPLLNIFAEEDIYREFAHHKAGAENQERSRK